jgi:hypothetical protein
MGRTTAFNATLVLTSVFGALAALVRSFPALCGALFLLGSAVGVSSRFSLLPFAHYAATTPQTRITWHDHTCYFLFP